MAKYKINIIKTPKDLNNKLSEGILDKDDILDLTISLHIHYIDETIYYLIELTELEELIKNKEIRNKKVIGVVKEVITTLKNSKQTNFLLSMQLLKEGKVKIVGT